MRLFGRQPREFLAAQNKTHLILILAFLFCNEYNQNFGCCKNSWLPFSLPQRFHVCYWRRHGGTSLGDYL